MTFANGPSLAFDVHDMIASAFACNDNFKFEHKELIYSHKATAFHSPVLLRRSNLVFYCRSPLIIFQASNALRHLCGLTSVVSSFKLNFQSATV